ncbi:ribonuclease PH [Egibacter rhizosphaerae]|uniref:Ribonuclease PH n=1 Tax=Egibacter rhizosphaerae TaxID=1670831 RepID=A0A411YKZ5_9ACTN|nr:ribonuclease PH [Egibacter rhizosphaerae]
MRTGVQAFPAGSVEIECGQTRVLCAASVESGVPPWRRDSGLGWVTAEYSMLPGATSERSRRESTRGRIGGRTHEIQRLIGRSLRAAIDLGALGEVSIVVDCDVVQADGGTRTASVTGGWVVLQLALDALYARGELAEPLALEPLAAVSVGIVDGRPVLDLDYVEDSAAAVDMNVVVVGDETPRFVEVQGTGEEAPFDRGELDGLLDLALAGCERLREAQLATLHRARSAVA